MKMSTVWVRVWVMTLLLAFTVGLIGVSGSAWAQENAKPKRSFVQKHRHLTSMAAGVAAYKAAKVTGKNRAMHGKKKNFAQRHPFMTGIGAAAATNHVIKKSEKKNQ